MSNSSTHSTFHLAMIFFEPPISIRAFTYETKQADWINEENNKKSGS